ncbi:transporter [Dyella sp. C9]|uniref:SphA family protein n=1 Tax=Dyella sp. C9 TaxID=2202154 RepID=UPI000DEFBD08|nr:transporter [Dyella sp. C9]
MRHHACKLTSLTALLALAAVAAPASATEGASGMYLLGGQTLDAGLSPPPGWYLAMAASQYNGSVGGTIQGGLRVAELRKKSDGLTTFLIFAPKPRILGGQLVLSVGMPYAYLRLTGEIDGPNGVRKAAVSGSGKGDTVMVARLGWQSATFSHAVSLTAWAPTGDYQKGFTPSIGHNRWAGDVMWAFTYAPGNHRTEFSGAIGYDFNGPNTLTHYRSGNEAHLELGLGRRLTPHLELGLGAYAYRQVTADSGAGATLGALKGRVYGAGPAVNYSLQVGGHGLVFLGRYFKEFDAERHFQGNLALISATLSL